MVNQIEDAIADERYFLLENPHNGAFWTQPSMVKLMQRHDLFYDYGHMCAYGLCVNHGGPIKKPTGWLTNNWSLLQCVNKKCNGQHDHEECMGGNARAAAIYTKQLACSLIAGLIDVLHNLGDERFLLHDHSNSSSVLTTSIAFPTSTAEDADYGDLQKDPEQWRPLLKEAAERLEGKTSVYATVKPSAYMEQIKLLVPWHLVHVQIYRTPKMRRLPSRLILDNPDVTHRGAALLFQDGTISVESQDISSLEQPSTRFDRTVRVAIFLYGKPMHVETSQQRRAAHRPRDAEVEPEEAMMDWEPGAKDMTFPGLSEDQLPKWMRSVLKRLHTNLGHPHNSTFVRQLSQAGASSTALMGARALKCAVCDRMRPIKQQRPSKPLPIARRFNERVMLDLLFAKDMTGETFTFLNQVDDTTNRGSPSQLQF